MEELRIDLRMPEQADPAESKRCAELCFKLNHTMPTSEEYIDFELRNCSKDALETIHV